MRRLLAASLLLILGGCAHLLPPRPAWQCFAHAEANGVRAISWRLLDRSGRSIEAREEWMRGFALKPRDFYATYWVHRGSPLPAADGEVVMRLAPRFRPVVPFRLELRSGSADGPAIARGKLEVPDSGPELRLPWSRMGTLLNSGAPLFLVATDRAGARRDAEEVPLTAFRTGFALVQQVTGETMRKAARFAEACEPHQEIILT